MARNAASLCTRAFCEEEDPVPQGPLRKSHDKVIAGVCGGLAEWFGWPANRTRLAYVVLSIVSAAFPGILVYIILWIAMPGPESR